MKHKGFSVLILAAGMSMLDGCSDPREPLFEWPPPPQPPNDATVPLTVVPTVFTQLALGIQALELHRTISGKVHQVDDRAVRSETTQLVPGRLNCVAVRFTVRGGDPPLKLAMVLEYAMDAIPVYPRPGDVLKVWAEDRGNPNAIFRSYYRIILSNEAGEIYYEKVIERGGPPQVMLQSEVSDIDLNTCRSRYWEMRSYFSEDD